jgi:hypothetical protein
MQDVKDLNPDMTDADLEQWADRTDNPALAEYLRSCKNE